MVALDASVLAYAVNRHAPEHPRAARVVEDLADGDTPWALPWPAVHDFLGFVTHPHAVVRPLGPGDAWGFIERLLSSTSVRALGPTERHAAVLAEVLAGAPTTSGGLPGLQLAVTLREHGVRELLSSDRGMRRFVFLSVRDPLHGEPWTSKAAPLRRYRTLRSTATGV
jgi:toxin-antitoxin system PIN domain toxin